MSNDAEAQEVHTTVTDSEDPMEPADGDRADPIGRPGAADQIDRPGVADGDDEVSDVDAIIIAEDAGDPAGLDEPEEGTYDGPVTAEAIVVETVAAEPVPASGPGGPKHAAADSAASRAGMPVDGEAPEATPMAGDAARLHERWAAIQSTFVDDPRGSVSSAADMVAEVIATVVESARQREAGLRGEWDHDGVDTEGLRNALRHYRALLDQLTTL